MVPENVYYPKQLYKGVIYTKGGDNRMMYLGMQNQAFSFPMFDAQALWSLQYILKNITVPCKEDVLKDIKTWSQRYLLLIDTNSFIQIKYLMHNF